MGRKKKHAEHVNHERWLISYADFITLLMAFFVVMFAVSQVDAKKAGRFTEAFKAALGIISKTPMSQREVPVSDEPPPNTDDPDAKPQGVTPLREIEAELRRRIALDPNFGGMTVLWRGNDLVLRLDASALFDSGEDAIKGAAKSMLKVIAADIGTRSVQLRIEGHTDNVPIRTVRFRSNWDLSTARATSVVEALVREGSVDPHRVAAIGYAEFQPIATNDTKEGRAMNRRVDFVISAFIEPPKVPVAPAPGSGPGKREAGSSP